jgi:ATP-dependent DNA helicase DinG
LPDYRYLIVDEAHHLEAATTDGLSFNLSRADLERQLKDLGGPNSGLLGAILSGTLNTLPPDLYAALAREVDHAYDAATTALALADKFFAAVSLFLEEEREGRRLGEYPQQVRIAPATRGQLEWERIEAGWEDLCQTLTSVADSVSRLGRGLSELAEYDIEGQEDLTSAANSAARRFLGIIENVNGLVVKPDPTMIYWAEANPHGERISIHAAPLHVGPLVEKHVWHTKESVVMTSATLTTGHEFDYFKGRLNADEADELALGSPFDYETSTLLYLVNDIPEPVDKFGYQKAIENGLISLCKATRGRALVLFTSHAQLRQTAQAIRDPLSRAGIEVYDQSSGSSRTTLLDSFRTSDGGVLMGTKSFWEGVDVPGEALSVLVIVRLPFDVPTEPIVAARAETFERPFDEYSLPEAVLRFRQGFGRLIRCKSDRGVVAIFDRRVLTKVYGRMFLDSLPTCTVRQGPIAQLPREAAKWIDGR